MNKPQPQTGPEIEEYSTTATPKAYAGSSLCSVHTTPSSR